MFSSKPLAFGELYCTGHVGIAWRWLLGTESHVFHWAFFPPPVFLQKGSSLWDWAVTLFTEWSVTCPSPCLSPPHPFSVKEATVFVWKEPHVSLAPATHLEWRVTCYQQSRFCEYLRACFLPWAYMLYCYMVATCLILNVGEKGAALLFRVPPAHILPTGLGCLQCFCWGCQCLQPEVALSSDLTACSVLGVLLDSNKCDQPFFLLPEVLYLSRAKFYDPNYPFFCWQWSESGRGHTHPISIWKPFLELCSHWEVQFFIHFWLWPYFVKPCLTGQKFL